MKKYEYVYVKINRYIKIYNFKLHEKEYIACDLKNLLEHV